MARAKSLDRKPA